MDPRACCLNAEQQLANLVRRDRNHPSVFVWSVGNEIGTSVDESSDGMSFGRLAAMREMVLKHDPTRPVGIGCHTPNTVAQPVYDPLDLTGWNYGRRYDRYREMYPDLPILYSESASAVSTRGFYAFPLAGSKTDYPGGTRVCEFLRSQRRLVVRHSGLRIRPDGEGQVRGRRVRLDRLRLSRRADAATGQEARSSYFGIVDLAGIPKDRYYLYRSHWRPDETTIHILPHWNWPDRVGKNVPVFVYTNGDSAELFLNGKSLGRRTKGVVPPKPRNAAQGKSATASSGGNARLAVDGDAASEWLAEAASANAWLQVDLGAVQPVKQITAYAGIHRRRSRISGQGLERRRGLDHRGNRGGSDAAPAPVGAARAHSGAWGGARRRRRRSLRPISRPMRAGGTFASSSPSCRTTRPRPFAN